MSRHHNNGGPMAPFRVPMNVPLVGQGPTLQLDSWFITAMVTCTGCGKKELAAVVLGSLIPCKQCRAVHQVVGMKIDPQSGGLVLAVNTKRLAELEQPPGGAQQPAEPGGGE